MITATISEQAHDRRIGERALEFASRLHFTFEVPRELFERVVELTGELGGTHDRDEIAGEDPRV